MSPVTHLRLVALLSLLSLSGAFIVPTDKYPRDTAPSVNIDAATVVGFTANNAHQFLGIPFAEPTSGKNRFNVPVPIPSYSGTLNATAFGLACPQPSNNASVLSPQQGTTESLSRRKAAPDQEDCLSLNVVTPINATPSSKLPVLVWIYGGGFQNGASSMYDGAPLVNHSVDIGLPIIYVSINYRVSAYGFIGGSEVKAARVGNLGLRDQRVALKWVQKYISKFGGDPTKVTIWGQSAGAMSIGLQLTAYGGTTDGLFRAAFMESGGPLPVGDISTNGQASFDNLVAAVGCSSAPVKLNCLRTVSYDVLKAAVDRAPGLSDYASHPVFMPRFDGDLLQTPPYEAVQKGRVANVPYITGNVDDEGTVFAFSTLNVTTDAGFRSWFSTSFFPRASSSELGPIYAAYTSDVTQGSPYDTGTSNAITPQYKRIASVLGDLTFQISRRNLLKYKSPSTPAWSYLNKRGKSTPTVGSLHGSDLRDFFEGGEMRDYLIRFVSSLDPNVGPSNSTLVSWPQYDVASKKLLLLQDSVSQRLTTTTDTYRSAAMETFNSVVLKYPPF